MASLPTMRAYRLRDRAVPDGEGVLPPLPEPEYVEVTLTLKHVGSLEKFLFTVTRNLREREARCPGWAQKYPQDATMLRQAEEVAGIMAGILGARSAGGVGRR